MDTLGTLRAAATFILAGILSMPAFGSDANGGELSKLIVSGVLEHQPAESKPLSVNELRDIAWTGHALSTAAYFPLGTGEAKSTLDKAIADAAAVDGATASSLARAGLSALLDTIGHGATLVDINSALTAPAKAELPWVATRQIGALRLITMPRLALLEVHCRNLLNEPTTDAYDFIVLDLRGNEGGPVKTVATVASHFLDPEQPLFRVEMKNAGSEEFATMTCGPAPVKQPLAVLIDRKTDSGGLLLAAVLQDHRRAIVIGEQKPIVNGAVSNLMFSPNRTFALKLPVGEIKRSNGHPLADGVHVDVVMPTTDEEALLEAALGRLGNQ